MEVDKKDAINRQLAVVVFHLSEEKEEWNNYATSEKDSEFLHSMSHLLILLKHFLLLLMQEPKHKLVLNNFTKVTKTRGKIKTWITVDNLSRIFW